MTNVYDRLMAMYAGLSDDINYHSNIQFADDTYKIYIYTDTDADIITYHYGDNFICLNNAQILLEEDNKEFILFIINRAIDSLAVEIDNKNKSIDELNFKIDDLNHQIDIGCDISNIISDIADVINVHENAGC